MTAAVSCFMPSIFILSLSRASTIANYGLITCNVHVISSCYSRPTTYNVNKKTSIIDALPRDLQSF